MTSILTEYSFICVCKKTFVCFFLPFVSLIMFFKYFRCLSRNSSCISLQQMHAKHFQRFAKAVVPVPRRMCAGIHHWWLLKELFVLSSGDQTDWKCHDTDHVVSHSETKFSHLNTGCMKSHCCFSHCNSKLKQTRQNPRTTQTLLD